MVSSIGTSVNELWAARDAIARFLSQGSSISTHSASDFSECYKDSVIADTAGNFKRSHLYGAIRFLMV